MIYTGIGARKTPKDIKCKMRSFGIAFARMGFTLRSGGASGADTAFEVGCFKAHGDKEIYLPWPGFNQNPSNWNAVSKSAENVAREIWERTRRTSFKKLKRNTRLFMGRNAYQILGPLLDKPCDFVVCWTPDGCETADERTEYTGGTGQAIAHASILGIPVFNLQRTHREDELMEFLASNENT